MAERRTNEEMLIQEELKMPGLPSENTIQNEDNGRKPAREKRERKTATRRRTRSMSVEITLSGEVAKWLRTEADANYRTLEGQITYCIAQSMPK